MLSRGGHRERLVAMRREELRKSAKVHEMTKMRKTLSPIGATVAEDIERTRADKAAVRDEFARLAGFEELARIVIMRRAKLDLSQEDLAKRMGTTASVISRIESGQHTTSAKTLKRLGEALEGKAIIGFNFGSEKRPKRELVGL